LRLGYEATLKPEIGNGIVVAEEDPELDVAKRAMGRETKLHVLGVAPAPE
jgi:hypothetical protein